LVLIGVGVIVAALGLISVMFMAKGLVSPIRDLMLTVRAYGSGDLHARASVDSHDEIGLLASNFNDMAERIFSLNHRLAERVEVVSQPKVMLLNNQSAMVQVGTVTSFVANTTTTTTQAGLATTSATTDQVQEGVTLRLMASILNDEILVQLTPVVTTLDKLRSINMGQGVTIEAPKISTKSMHTLVKIKDGNTIAVGGLITSNNNKSEEGIPILRKLPLIGGLFEYKSKTSERRELVIFITPKILQK